MLPLRLNSQDKFQKFYIVNNYIRAHQNSLCYNSIMELEQQIKQLIIDSLELEDISIDDIQDEEPLFNDGLGLDSIDALEIGMALKKEYNLTLSKNKEENKKVFYSVKTIADFIRTQK